MTFDMIIDIFILGALFLLAGYIFTLKRKITILHQALLDAEPVFKAYQGAIDSHSASLSGFRADLDQQQAYNVEEDDLPGVFYAKFGGEGKR